MEETTRKKKRERKRPLRSLTKEEHQHGEDEAHGRPIRADYER